MYRVLLERGTEKDLARLSSEIHNRVIAEIQALANNPRPLRVVTVFFNCAGFPRKRASHVQ